jgi:hypothetical protein
LNAESGYLHDIFFTRIPRHARENSPETAPFHPHHATMLVALFGPPAVQITRITRIHAHARDMLVMLVRPLFVT